MSKRAVLLVNLGSPASTSVSDVRKYLHEFLGDDRVIDRPAKPLRRLLVHGLIVPLRAPKSAHAYESVWTKDGSPLITTSKSVREKLAAQLGAGLPVYLAMRYGQPSIASVVQQIAADGITEILLFPQYPHYAMSSYETVVVEVFDQVKKICPTLRITTVQPFYQDSDYIEALYQVTAPYLSQPHDHVLFSFHGIPVRHLRKGDSSCAHCTKIPDCCTTTSPAHATCYKAQCLATTRALVARAGIAADRHSVSYQSRLVGEPWLSPYTDYKLVEFPKIGIKKLLIMTPAFVADCLETIEEIAVEGRDTFMEAGGETFQAIPCLNDQPPYINFLHTRVQNWLQSSRSA